MRADQEGPRPARRAYKPERGNNSSGPKPAQASREPLSSHRSTQAAGFAASLAAACSRAMRSLSVAQPKSESFVLRMNTR